MISLPIASNVFARLTQSIVHVHHRRVAIVLLLVSACTLPWTFWMLPHPVSRVNLRLIDEAESGTLTMGAARPNERQPVPTPRIRYDIPGWDSIRRPAAATNISAVDSLAQIAPGSILPERLLVPLVLGLLFVTFGWIGFFLVLRCSTFPEDARAADRWPKRNDPCSHVGVKLVSRLSNPSAYMNRQRDHTVAHQRVLDPTHH
jgi:hypothetical protein